MSETTPKTTIFKNILSKICLTSAVFGRFNAPGEKILELLDKKQMPVIDNGTFFRQNKTA